MAQLNLSSDYSGSVLISFSCISPGGDYSFDFGQLTAGSQGGDPSLEDQGQIYRVFSRMPLVGLPAGATITKVELQIGCTVDFGGNTDSIYGMFEDPATQPDAGTLFNDVTYNNYNSWNPVGGVTDTIDLGSQAITDLINQNALWIGITGFEDKHAGATFSQFDFGILNIIVTYSVADKLYTAKLYTSKIY